MKAIGLCFAIVITLITNVSSRPSSITTSFPTINLLISNATISTNATKFDHRLIENPTLFQGDIKFDRRLYFFGISDNTARWPQRKIPFVNRIAYNKRVSNTIKRAMSEIESKTCIRFFPRKSEQNYIEIFPGNGCWSFVGRIGSGKQQLSIGRGCEHFPIIVHELMHAVGFFHKHSRHDRDDYLDIHWDNIPRSMWSQFEKLKRHEGKVFTPFDYESIMLYGSRTFSKDGRSMTMSRKDNKLLIDVENKLGLSRHDAFSINRLYDCPTS